MAEATKVCGGSVKFLEEDDHFEEFPTAGFDSKEDGQADVNVWEDNWDDDTVEDDFSVLLSRVGRKRTFAAANSPPKLPVAQKLEELAMVQDEPLAKKIRTRISPMKNGGTQDAVASQPTRSTHRLRQISQPSLVQAASANHRANGNQQPADKEDSELSPEEGSEEFHQSSSRENSRTRSGGVSSRTRSSSRGRSAAQSPQEPRTPTRSSARLRSSRK